MAGGHVFCAPRNLCVFLFTYLSFTTLLKTVPGVSSLHLERFCIFPNSFPCLQYRAKEHPNWNLLDRLVQDTTSWKFISALLWCSTLPTQWWWFVCPMTYLWILDRQLRSLQIYLQSEALKFPISTSAALRTRWIPFAFSSKTILWMSSQFPKLGWVLK